MPTKTVVVDHIDGACLISKYGKSLTKMYNIIVVCRIISNVFITVM